MTLLKFVPANRRSPKRFRVPRRHIRKNSVVDRTRRRVIAPPEARHIANLHVALRTSGESRLEIRSQFARPVQMAAHVRANANLRPRRWHKMKMRIKTRNAVKLIKRRLRSRRQRFKL